MRFVPVVFQLRLALAVLAALAALATLATLAPAAPAGSWTYATLDPANTAGNSLSMRLNPQGLRRWAWWTIGQGIVVTGDGWGYDVFPGPYAPQSLAAPGPATAGRPPASPASPQLLVTYSVSLALGPDDSPWIAHVRHDCFGNCTGTAYVSHRAGATWSTDTLGTAYSRPWIEVGADGRVHVAYASSAYEVRYWVRATDGTWTNEPVGHSYGMPALKLDAAGTPHLAWDDGGRIRYAVREDGAWQAQVVDSVGCVAPGLALTTSGTAVLEYGVARDGVPATLWVAEEGAGGWTRSPAVAGVPWAATTGFALDPAGEPCLAFNDQNGLDLRWASRRLGTWTVENIDTYGNTGYSPSLAFAPSGRPLVAYQADASLGVRLATGDVVVGVPVATVVPPRFAIRLPAGVARAGRPLVLEVTSPVATRVSLRLLDVAGRALARLPERDVPAGVSALRWDAGALRPGVCFVRAAAAGGAVATTRVPVTR